LSKIVDVGGGNYRDQDTDAPKLANISLRWMLHEIHCNSDVVFKNELLDQFNVPEDCVRRIKEDEIEATEHAAITRFATDDTVVNGHHPSSNKQVVAKKKYIPVWERQDESDIKHAEIKDEMNMKQVWWYIAQLFTWSGKA
jgi:hypothetical protein